MKKRKWKMAAWTVCAFSLALAAHAAEDQGAAAAVTEDEAKVIALEHAGVQEQDTSSLRVQTDREDGVEVYDVEFWTAAYEAYDYEIRIEDGEILSASYDREGADAQGGTAVTLEEAQELVLAHAGETADTVTFLKAKEELDDGRRYYDLEFRTEQEKEFEYEVSCDTGAMLEWSYDADGYLIWKQGGTTGTDIGVEGAKAAALEMAGLTADADVTWRNVHEDRDDGRTVYEGTFFYEEMEYEFEVDAETGTIVSWEVESIYD